MFPKKPIGQFLLFSSRYCINVSMRTYLSPVDRLTLSFIVLLTVAVLLNVVLHPILAATHLQVLLAGPGHSATRCSGQEDARKQAL